MTAHTVVVIATIRRAHDLLRKIHRARCDGCVWKGREHHAYADARREGTNHERSAG